MRGLVALSLGCVALVVTAAPAQVPRLQISAAGGVALPMGGNPGTAGASSGGGFKDVWSLGLSGSAELGYSLPVGVYVGLAVDYSKFPLNTSAYLGPGGGSVTGGDLSVVAFGVELRYTLSRLTPVQPYITLGAQGLKLSDVQVSSTTSSGSQQQMLSRSGLAQDLGVLLGGGLAFRAGGARLFADARAIIGAAAQVSYLSVRGGVRL